MDPSVLPLSPDGDATSQASSTVAMMRAAAEAKQRALSQTALQNQYKQAEEDRMQTQGDLAAAREKHIQAQDQNADLQRTMAGDMAITSQNPTYAGKSWDQVDTVDPTLRPSYADRYGVENAANAGRTWNQAMTQNTGVQVGAPITPPTTAQILHASSQGVEHTPGESSDDLAAKVSLAAQARQNGVPADLKSELGRMGKWQNGMTLEDAQQARDQGYVESGMIPEKYQGAATKLMGQIAHNPILAPFAKQKEAYDTMKSGMANPEAGGFSDMALIEGFQRIVNPGAVVRQGTMDNMKAAAGWLQQLDPSFQWGKATIGDKLTPQARQRLMSLADQNFATSQRTAARELASKRNLARMLGIPPAMTDNFVNSVLSYVANDDGQQPQAQGQQPQTQPTQPAANGQPAVPIDTRNPIQQVLQAPQGQAAQNPPSSMVRMVSPEGVPMLLPSANVEAARERGFK